MVETTDNAFLGGKLRLLQPRDGYRAGIDPVLLAAACAPRPGAHVLDMGCGVGTALFCLASRVAGLDLTGVEIEPSHAALARENAARNGFGARIVEADIARMPADLRNRSFDAVIANPPYFDRQSSDPSPDASREAGRGESVPLSTWVEMATKRLAPKGQLVVISRVERLAELLSAAGSLGSLEIIPFQPRDGRPARLVILRARKGGRGDLRLHPAIILHRGTTHARDGDDYTDGISAVLRQGVALPIV